MLHIIPDATALPRRFVPTVAANLLKNAFRPLDDNPRVARQYFEQLATMFDDSARDARPGKANIEPPVSHIAPVKGGLASWQLRLVVRHIDDRLGSTISVDALAEVARLSSGQFRRAFKATTDETPHAFLIRQRVRRAQTLMLRTDDTLSQIAYACGLTDPAHLSRLFRRVIGVTPLIWRRTFREVC